MKAMNRISRHIHSSRKALAIGVALVSICLGGCTYDTLPPKTDDANSNYVVPKGTVPSDADKALLETIRAEYEANTSNK